MTDIEQVSDWALSIAAEAAGSKLHHYERMSDDNRLAQSIEAHARAIEQHEAFRQEVSDALVTYQRADTIEERNLIWDAITRFIIPKPDPLVEAYNEALPETAAVHGKETVQHICAKISAALAARGLKIVEVGHD